SVNRAAARRLRPAPAAEFRNRRNSDVLSSVCPPSGVGRRAQPLPRYSMSKLFRGPVLIAGLAMFLSPVFVTAADPINPVTRMSFRDADGKSAAWADLTGAKATVVVFLAFDCPVSNSYATPLSELATAYAGKGVKFIGMCPCDDPAAAIVKQA